MDAMTARTLLLAAIGLLAAAGCRRDPYINKYVESLHGDVRVLEDYVYQLEHENSVLVDELEACRDRNPAPARRSPLSPTPSGSSSGSANSPSRSAPRTNDFEPASPSGRSDLPNQFDLSPPDIDPGDLSPPRIDPGTPEPPSIDAPPSTLDVPQPLENLDPIPPLPRTDGASASGGNSSNRASASQTARPTSARSAVVDRNVAYLSINPYLSGGRDADQQMGDDGISLVVEPRNADDQYLKLPAPVSVALIDPELEGEAMRVARWDFTAEQVRELMRVSQHPRGFEMWLPFNNGHPRHDRLRLFVRYIAADGRKVQTDQEMFITLPGQYSQRWTPRSVAGVESASADPVRMAGHTEAESVAPAQPR